MKRRIRLFAVISLIVFAGIAVISVMIPVSEMQFGSSMETIAYETAAVRDSSGNLSTTNDDIYIFGMGDFNLSMAERNITIGKDVESIRVKSVLYREVVYDANEPLNLSFSEELSIYYENESITKKIPEGFMFLESDAIISSTKPLELTISESTIDNYGLSNITIQNEFKFRVAGTANYTINYFVHIEVIQILEESPPVYIAALHILLPAIGILSAAMILFETERSET